PCHDRDPAFPPGDRLTARQQTGVALNRCAVEARLRFADGSPTRHPDDFVPDILRRQLTLGASGQRRGFFLLDFFSGLDSGLGLCRAMLRRAPSKTASEGSHPIGLFRGSPREDSEMTVRISLEGKVAVVTGAG